MHQPKLLGIILGLSALIAVLHFIALEFFLYWIFPWFDLLMHFAGGFLVACIGLWGLSRVHKSVLSKRQALITTLSVVIIVGVGWELFEYLAGLTRKDEYVLDTTGDLVADIIGGLSAYRAITYSRLRSVLEWGT